MAKPLLIREGPIGASSASSGDPYWFQQGAFGVNSPICDTCKSVGASVMIRTVYDSVNNDAHSYWIGAILSNGAFVQVGYLNGLTTTGQYYCCAWFYEFFPPGNTTSPPIIGLIGSAGPIGSWHTYTMNSTTSSNVWSFYIDNQYLGSSPGVGNKWNLGSSDTGSNPVAALSEVADTSVRTDTIGPAEFKNMEYASSNPNSFQPVPNGKAHIGCGESPTSCLPNPYGVAEITNRTGNDFLAGSVVAPGASGSNQCGSPTSNNGLLWSTTLGPTCTGTNFSFSFVDHEGGQVTPNWIGLVDTSGTQIFYTSYQAQLLPSPQGQWTITQVSWHSINVTTSEVINSPTNQTFLTDIFSVRLTVVGYFYSLPVKNATVIMYLPDSTNQTARTDSNGEASFTQLPPAAYSLHIQVPYGITSNQVHTLSSPGSVVAKVFSLPELITIIIPPILIAIIASAAVARREHRRQQMMPAQPFLPQPLQPPVAATMFCRRCGAPLGPNANFCTSCGTPVRMMVQ